MALDEAILLESAPDALVLRVYAWTGKGCTFGYSQRYALAKKLSGGVDPVRRATGGGVVMHDEGEVTFSLVFSWNRTLAPETIYKNIHRGIHQALKERGTANGIWSPKTAPEGIAAACFSRAEKMDLVDADDNKILGGALRKKGSKGLYQGSLRVNVSNDVVIEGITREFGRPSVDLQASWIAKGSDLETRYRSSEWNTRR